MSAEPVGQTPPDSGDIVLWGCRLDRQRDSAQRRRIAVCVMAGSATEPIYG